MTHLYKANFILSGFTRVASCSRLKLLFLLPMFLVINSALAQRIEGPIFCTVGETRTYEFIDTYRPDEYTWGEVTGGTKTFTSKEYANIKWTTPGINVVRYINSGGEYELTVDVVSPGGYASAPVDAGVITPCKSFTHTANFSPQNYYSDDIGDTGDDIFYKFTLYEQQEVEISHCGSNLMGTYLYLLNNALEQIDFNGGNGPLCSGQASLRRTLGPGVYYVVTEGEYDNGIITTKISVPMRAGATKGNAIDAGTISLTGTTTYTNTQSNTTGQYFCNDYGQQSDDIYYKFTLTESTTVAISHCESALSTFLHLLDVNGNVLAANGGNGPQCSTDRASIRTNLGPGIYYVVSEGSNTNAGSITTKIQALAPPPSVTISSSGNSICRGDLVTFTATVSNGGANPTYQWKINGVNVGGNSATFSTTEIYNTDDEVWVEVISSLPGSLKAASNTIYMDVYSPRPGTLASSLGPSICAGADGTSATTISFTNHDGTPHYWVSSNGGVSWNIYNDITPGNSFTLSLNTAGTWIIRGRLFDPQCGWGEVKELSITVNPTPQVTIAAASSGVNLYTTLTATEKHNSDVLYTWSRTPASGSDVEFETSSRGKASIRVKPTQATTYTVTATTSSGACVGQASITIGGNNYNYVIENTILKEGYTTEEELESVTVEERQQQVTYFDGLGREMQSVLTQASPGKKDIVTPVTYDAVGRIEKTYLPYVSGENGYYKTEATTDQPTFYSPASTAHSGIAKSANPWAVPLYEASPLNRVLEQGAPGEVWQLLASGATDAGHTIKSSFRTNTATEVRLWSYDAGSDNFSSAGHYGASMLYVNETTDEQGALVVEYKDKQGRVVAKKVQEDDNIPDTKADGGFMVTQYVYDDLGNLRLVIQPEGARKIPATATWSTTPEFISQWCFRYTYDGRRRLVEKQVPGAGKVYMVYDPRDLPVLTQDAEQGRKDEWSYVRYDAFNRSVETGIYRPGQKLSQAQMQDQLNTFFASNGTTETAPEADPAVRYGDVIEVGAKEDNYLVYQASQSITLQDGFFFSSASGGSFTAKIGAQPATSGTGTFPAATDSYELLTQTFYDHYEHGALAGKATFTPEAGVAAEARNERVRGQVTGTRVKVPGLKNSQNQDLWLTTVNFYDAKYRLLQSVADNHLGGVDRVTTLYDFVGEPKQVQTTHQTLASTHTVVDTLTYDHADRLLQTWKTMDNGPKVLLAQQEYNELGQLIDKKLHSKDNGNSFLQSVDYRYNIRGWLTSINNKDLVAGTANDDSNDIFGLELSYNAPGGTLYDAENGLTPATGYFNGNISEALWRTTNSPLRGYSYHYDKANRLTTANYFTGNSSSGENYRVWGIGYDANGNIQGMKRKGLLKEVVLQDGTSQKTYGDLDILSYYYGPNSLEKGNQLLGVDDSQTTASLHDFEDKDGRKYSAIAPEYSYDLNGNLTADANKGITTVTYNHMNLPTKVDMGAAKGYISYLYSATGQKLRKEVHAAGKPMVATDYVGSFVYQADTLFAHTQEGRVLYDATKPTGQKWRYEYHLKDHLGNLRVSFAEPVSTTSLATMELMAAPQEEQEFEHVAETRHLDGVKSRSGQHAALLSVARNKPMGPSKRVELHKGDSLHVKAFGLYEKEEKNNVAFSLATWFLSNAVVSTANPVAGGEQQVKGTKNKALPYLGVGLALAPQIKQLVKGAPKAYLRYIVYDKDSAYVTSGYRAVTKGAEQDWEELELSYTARQDGFAEVYVANESGEEVWFDDMSVSTTQPMLVQENHFDPWGLNLVGIEKQGQPDHKFQYNGKERQTELGLNWMDYGARMYDAQLGRWHVVDPLADHPKQIGTSPYAYAANNPIRFIDPTGMIWEDPKQAERLNKSINNRIESVEKNSSKIQAQIDKGGLSEKKLAKLEGKLADNSQKVELLNQSLSDVVAIGNAAETYRLTGPSSSDGTHGVVKGSNGVINIEGSNTALHIHEIRHVGQSIEAGGVKFNKDGKLLNAATTLEGARNNEVNAYQTQYSFDGSYPAGASSLKDINGTTLMNIKTSDGKTVYEKLKDKKK